MVASAPVLARRRRTRLFKEENGGKKEKKDEEGRQNIHGSDGAAVATHAHAYIFRCMIR